MRYYPNPWFVGLIYSWRVVVKASMWGATDVGRSRKINEDSFLLSPDHNFVAVADGMGGYQRGDVAAQLACNVVKEVLYTHKHVVELFRRAPSEATASAVKTMLDTTMQRACKEVHDAAVAMTGKGGRMGTTMDIVLFVGSKAFVAHVGDGRVFLLRGGEIHKLTEDHTVAAQEAASGVPPEQRSARNVITRALGVFPNVMVDSLVFDLQVDDRVIICTDGLYGYVDESEMAAEVAKGEVAEVVDQLIGLANQRGGRDNISVVVFQVDAEGKAEQDQDMVRRLERLRNVGLFQFCTYRELMKVCQMAAPQTVPAGSVLFEEGAQGRECFIVEEGEITIRKAGQVLAVMRSGDYFGEMSFIDVPRRSATAVATRDAQLLVIGRNQFLQLLKQDSELAAKLMWQLLQKMSRLVRSTNRRLVNETTAYDGHEMIGNAAGNTILEEG
jgi:serine/threonine protein phosphatase PrpC/CRP-like cAMP-binding protein